MVATAAELVGAGEIILALGVKLALAVGLVEPKGAEGTGGIADDAFGDSEAPFESAVGFEVSDFALDHHFAGAKVGDVGDGLVVFVGAGEQVEQVADSLDASLAQRGGGFGTYTFDGGNVGLEIHRYIITPGCEWHWCCLARVK